MKKEIYNLTQPQKSIWLTEKAHNNSCLNNICGTLFFREDVNIELLKTTIEIFINRNDAMRTKIIVENGMPHQFISNDNNYRIETINVKNKEELSEEEHNTANTPFNLLNSNLYCFKVFKLENGTGGLIAHLHHLIGDAWSFGLMATELKDIYQSLLQNKNLPNNKHSYIEFILAEQEYLKSEKYIEDKKYWESKFEELPELATPKYYNSLKKVDLQARRLETELSKELSNKISKYCKINKTSLYSFLMAIYSIYLSKVSGIDDVIIGTPLLNRSNFKQKNTMGMFINTVPNKIQVNSNLKFCDFVSSVTAEQRAVFRHQKYPLNQLLETIRKKHQTSRGLYDVALSYQNARDDSKEAEIDYITYWTFNGNALDSLQIHVYDMDNEGSLKIYYDYQINKFEENELIGIHKRILEMISQILSREDILVKDIDIVTEEEKYKLLHNCNLTERNYPNDKTISKLFEEQVKKTPNNIAVIYKDKSITYKELNEEANMVGHYLKENLDIKLEDIVCVHMNKNIDCIISILAIIKAGAAYLPISKEYPKKRINYIVENSNAKAIITDSEIDIDIPKVTIEEAKGYNINNLNCKISSNNLAYLIYTSGSTGNPKGVMIEHKNLINFIYSFSGSFKNGFDKDDNCLSLTNISFDVSVCEIFTPLLCGSTLILYPDNVLTDIMLLADVIVKNNVTFLYVPPNILEEVISILSIKKEKVVLKKLLVGVEPIKNSTLNKFIELYPNLEIINGYGPTETTICCTFFKYKYTKEDGIVPIGKALNNNIVVIKNKEDKLLPAGVSGEICVIGENVGRGYVGNKMFTYNCNEREYKTGDTGLLTKTGDIIFIGRNDNQVKINGYRIEIEEINKVIKKNDKVINSVVIVNDKQEICAYIVVRENIVIKEIKDYLLQELPYYMIPKNIMRLDKLPINSNGKIDKNKLPTNFKTEIRNKKLPKTKLEKELIDILKEVLGNDQIYINDNIFECGADSLTVIKFATLIYNKLTIEVSTKDIFVNPTAEKLAKYLQTKNSSDKENMTIQQKKDYYPISSAQKRIYITSQMANNGITYNMTGKLFLNGKLDIKRLENSFNELIKRHESLRTAFYVLDNGEIVQKIKDKIEIKLEYEKVNNTIDSEIKKFINPFDLSKAPLFRIKLLEINTNQYILLFDMHHIISDGVSMQIFISELQQLYNGEILEELKYTYKDYAVWENKKLNNDKSEQFWVNQFKEEVPILNFPFDYSRPISQSFNGEKITSKISKELSKKINKICKNKCITPYMMFLSAYYILLSKYTNQTDIVIGSPVANREHLEFCKIIGMFVNNIALRMKVKGDITINEFITNVKELCLESFNNQTYPFDKLVEKLNLKRHMNRNLLYDTMFIYQNMGEMNLQFKDIKAKVEPIENMTSKFDFSLEITPNEYDYHMVFEYCVDLLRKETVKTMIKHYKNILKYMVNNLDEKVINIDMLSMKEKNNILYNFNNTKVEYLKEKTISQLFEEQVQKTPDNIAIIFENKSLTYKELNKKANSLALYLRKKSIKPNDVISIMVERSLEMIIGILAILKAGACYTPIDPNLPKDRIEYMLSNSNAKVILTQKKLKSNINTEKVILIDLNSTIYSNDTGNLENINKPEDSSYLIYTSGSTGKPKGVQLTHKGLSNLCNYCNNNIDYLKDNLYRCIVSVTTISFDIFIFETLISLQKGLKLVIANEEEQHIPGLLDKLIFNHNIEIIQMTPSRMQIFINNIEEMPHFNNLKFIILAGEHLPLNLSKELVKLTNGKVYNGYGPSETTIFSTLTDVTNYKEITIGEPLDNTQIYILDKTMRPVAIGIVGEIYISGDGVGKGYVNNLELTKENFIQNPFIPNTILYKTGDYGFFRKDGKIKCLGRTDNQVKLHGLRIELRRDRNCNKGISRYIKFSSSVSNRKPS